ncbi:hypothetical protein [Pseudomonas sp. Leaf58]|uniref:hypothetical protein n=1 Tax=Pseudomonas sp. Leaf58 TaxID=1736226 RepID=UPI0006FAF23D|nr:hypothetical protein [Pseudomonas sp. Leaf58]KQN62442.1 hypothetical protein ASF02_09845 [Pseudomonas sp. Leaf58]
MSTLSPHDSKDHIVLEPVEPESIKQSLLDSLLSIGTMAFLVLAPLTSLIHLLKIESFAPMVLPGMIWLQMWNTLIRNGRGQNTSIGAIVEQTLLVGLFAGALQVGPLIAGDVTEVSKFINQHLAEITLCLICFIGTAYVRKLGEKLATHTQSLFGLPVAGHAQPLTALDRRIIAVHEAGHAVVLGLHRHLPLGMEIVMRKKTDDSGSLGYCTGPAWNHALDSKIHVEWEMLFALAGIEAERLLLGEISLGGASDYRNWNTLAQKYLSGHDDLIYFHAPQNTWQEDHNHKTLIELKRSQQALVRELLIANENILQLLSDQLEHDRKVAGQDLVEILDKVGAVAGCPASPKFKSIQD